MKKVLVGLILLSSMSVFAMQTPMGQSFKVVQQLISSISSDSSNQFLVISKVSIGNNNAKVELLDSNGDCFAYPYRITADNQGQTSVKLMTDAIAICD